ncbi:hypothetical protein ACWC4A_54370 [Streptomyces mirabilis]
MTPTTAARLLNGLTLEQQRSFVLGHTDRIRAALDKITAPYETPTPQAPPDPNPAADNGRDLQPPTCCPPTDVTTTADATLQETAALSAVLTGDRKGAQRIVASMGSAERAELANHLDELRKLLGTLCDNCGNLAEIGTSTTDPFSETCRFLCSRCTAARRTS